ncbi:hypothetical protein AVEN_40654-1 [Araneus ventricosus]|uniref:DNA helicase Pif1-like 2B domain-containing protein n=1 Tax=Araneus ventricosus TaxID=182803 RepID=A0A4Y2H0F8_ARAVE|nr:hypothetical protein AVEN_40654-1 [Araneus ventricosus]
MMDKEPAVFYPTKFLDSLNPPGMPPQMLNLKVGSSIMLLRNLGPPKLCNGIRFCVSKLMVNVIQATVLTGNNKEESVFILRITLIPSDMPFGFKRLQFPVLLAFAITMNKTQNHSVNATDINLETPCFSHGQLYGACSRVEIPRNLYICSKRRD